MIHVMSVFITIAAVAVAAECCYCCCCCCFADIAVVCFRNEKRSEPSVVFQCNCFLRISIPPSSKVELGI